MSVALNRLFDNALLLLALLGPTGWLGVFVVLS